MTGKKNHDIFELTWHFSRSEFDRLKALAAADGPLLPDGKIDQVYLKVSGHRAVLHTWYFGIKKGTTDTVNQRRTESTLWLNHSWLPSLFPRDIYETKVVSAITLLWPEDAEEQE